VSVCVWETSWNAEWVTLTLVRTSEGENTKHAWFLFPRAGDITLNVLNTQLNVQLWACVKTPETHLLSHVGLLTAGHRTAQEGGATVGQEVQVDEHDGGVRPPVLDSLAQSLRNTRARQGGLVPVHRVRSARRTERRRFGLPGRALLLAGPRRAQTPS